MTAATTNSGRTVEAGWRRLNEMHRLIYVALDSALQREFRLSLTEYEVMVALAESPEGDLRMQALAEVASLSQSALSRLIGRLQSTDLVERVVCEDDRRGRYIGLTSRGRALVDALRPVHARVLGEAIAAAMERRDLSRLAKAMSV